MEDVSIKREKKVVPSVQATIVFTQTTSLILSVSPSSIPVPSHGSQAAL